MRPRPRILAVSLLAAAFAGCLSGEDAPDERSGGAGMGVVLEPFSTILEPIDCPDLALTVQMPRGELQALLPAGLEAGDAHDFFLGLSPLSAAQRHAGAAPMGALILFIQECQDDTAFEEGYVVIFLKPPTFDLDLPATGLNFFPLQHAVDSDWLADASERTAWGLDTTGETSVEQTLGPTGRSASVAWSNATGELASVTASGLPAHPPLTYEATVRLWRPLDHGVVVYDHLAAGEMYPGSEITCSFAEQSPMAEATGQTDCSRAPGRAYDAFILVAHDPRIEVHYFPGAAAS